MLSAWDGKLIFPFQHLIDYTPANFTAYMKLSAEIDEDNSRLGMYRSLFYNFMSIFELKKKKQHYYRFEILLFAKGFTPASYQVHLK